MGDGCTLILDICAPPELHLMQDIVKLIYDKMHKECPGVSLWLERIHIKPKNYHHGTFVDNDCLKRLKNTDSLQQMADLNIQKYVHILRALHLIVTSCFGMKWDPQYKTYINEFKDLFIDLGISITPKVHILTEHVPEFIEKHGLSLDWYSEQALESVHYDFLRNCWEKQGFKRSLVHPDYAENLMKAVIVYSLKNIL
ncbi:unnamed protein product [Meganyctiphanes norvegica]|uniref:Uncharacterized protein n=1 Tax=Meganyctiphanes norvegica TaxID=48144 RepID=A0AAV2SUU3_MEGNR